MSKLMRRLIRASSFFGKEIKDILHQPRLILTLVLGPFIILFLFGISYSNVARSLRVWFVAQPDNALAQNIQQYADMLNGELIYSGLSSNLEDGLNRLRRGEVDLVIAAPQNPYETVLSNQQAVFTFYHDEIDPSQAGYVDYIGVLFVNAVNRAVLVSITSNLQKNLAEIQDDLQLAHQNTSRLRQAVQSGDALAARKNQADLTDTILGISLGVGASQGLMSNLQDSSSLDGSDTSQLQDTLADLKQNTDQLNQNTSSPKDQQLSRIDRIDSDLSRLDSDLTLFRRIDPAIVMSPFRNETKIIASSHPSQFSQLDFFAPAVLALLLQHMALTFAALSIVHERNSGAIEFFRISPLSAGEALLGKYASYMFFGAVIAAALSALLIFILHIPMLGNWAYFVLVTLALLFTSTGIGLTISILSQTDSQAVQYSMITLLASVFFSGLVTNLYYFVNPVKVISWLLPSTYGTIMLRDIILRGTAPDMMLLGGLVAMGLVFMMISWLLMRRQISSRATISKS